MELKEFCSMGGKARAAKLSKERRSEIARKAAFARWTGDVPNDVIIKCQRAYCEKAGKEVMVHGMKAWLCEEHER